MQERKPIHRTGVFMDHRAATFITESGKDQFAMGHTLEADEDRSTRGEHHYNNAKRGDTMQFYKQVAKQLLEYDEIYIFGPGKTQEEFINWLHEENHQFKTKRVSIGSADYISDNQKVAMVREHFEK